MYGYLDERGSGWRCERGFRQEKQVCAPLIVPLNAYVDYSGNDWRCESGFRRQDAVCKAD
jgi:hypothetical protein